MPDQKRAEPASFPKILFVHDYRPGARALADLVRQLFQGYPTNKIHWWHCRETPLYEKPELRAASLQSLCIPEKLVPHVRWTVAKAFILESLWSPLAARHLERTMATEKPDLVWALLFGWSIPALARVRWPAGQRLHVSLWDFPNTNTLTKVLGKDRSLRFASDIYQLVHRANSFDAICPDALDELRIQAGRDDGILVHSGFEPHHLAVLEKAPGNQEPDGIIRLAYVGTIISEPGFLTMLAALNAIRSQVSQKVALDFFGGRGYQSRAWFEPGWMTEHGMFTDEELVRSLRRCAWGIVVMDPSGEDPQYSRFSFPNKIGTYLSAGVPVLGFGHPTSSLGHIMRAHRLGRFTSATTRDEMSEFWLESLRVPSPQAAFRDDILRCARTEFNASEMRARLWQLWGVKLRPLSTP